MNDNEEPSWIRNVRISAEIAVVAGGGILAILDALESHRQLNEQTLEGALVAPSTPNPDEEE